MQLAIFARVTLALGFRLFDDQGIDDPRLFMAWWHARD